MAGPELGIVLSVLWFVGFFFWRMIDHTNNLSNLHISMFDTCWQSATHKREPLFLLSSDPQRDQKLAEIDRERDLCESEANAVSERLRRDLQARNETIILDAGLLALFWLLAGIVVRVSRWVIAGFRQEA